MEENLYTWIQLNDRLREMGREADVLALFEKLRTGGASPRWLRRTWGRYNQLRRRREKKELAKKIGMEVS